jgi:hypothetical protein
MSHGHFTSSTTDLLVVRDATHKDIYGLFLSEFQFTSRFVIGNRNRATNQRNLNNTTFYLCDFFGSNKFIRRTEFNGISNILTNTSTRTNGLVVYFVASLSSVISKPSLIDGSGERSTSTTNIRGSNCRNRSKSKTKCSNVFEFHKK